MKVVALEILALSVLAWTAYAQPAIYRCSTAGGTVYSDRPCEAQADRYETDASRITVYTPEPTPPAVSAATAKQPKAKRSKARAAAGIDPARQRIKCTKLDQALREVRTRMRGGYGVQEGERLKARQRWLDEQRRSEKCR